MASPERPFDEREQRSLLAEILKVSSISPLDLLWLIESNDLSPEWTEMILPNGRSVSACMRAYDLLSRAPAEPFVSGPLVSAVNTLPPAKLSKKRSAPGQGPLAPDERTIQGQASSSVNSPADHLPSPIGGPPQKKRGRPSKEEHERRVREAFQRGEIYPPPKKTKTSRQSLTGAAKATLGVMEENFAGKGKAKKSKAESAVTDLPHEIAAGNSALEATASAADHMEVESEEGTGKVVPEMQASDYSTREHLLAGMREHAATATPTDLDAA